MLSQDDLKHVIDQVELGSLMPITLSDIKFIQNEDKILVYTIKVTSSTEMPVSKQKELYIPVTAALFRKFTKVCGTISVCPVFPSGLLDISEPFDQAKINQSCFFFDMCIKHISNCQELRDSSALRSLLCKPNDLAFQEFTQALKDSKNSNLMAQTKTISNEIAQQTKQGFKMFGQQVKSLFQKMGKESPQTEAPPPQDPAYQGMGYEAGEIETEHTTRLQELAATMTTTKRLIKSYIQYLKDTDGVIKSQIKLAENFAQDQVAILGGLNKIDAHLQDMMIFPLTEKGLQDQQQIVVNQIRDVQIPVLEIALGMLEQCERFRDQAKVADQAFARCQEKLGDIQKKIAKMDRSKADKFQEKTREMNECIGMSDQLKTVKKETLHRLENNVTMLKRFLETEQRELIGNIINNKLNSATYLQTNYTRAKAALDSGAGVSCELVGGRFQVTLK